jgi:hypothetical protein
VFPLLPIVAIVGLALWLLLPDPSGGPVVTDKGSSIGGTRYTVADATRTSTGIANDLPERLLSNAAQAAALLDAIEKTGIVFTITSWYRSEAVNKAVGGVAGSAHTQALAVDLQIGNADEAMRALSGVAQLDKAIRYNDALPGKPSIHVQAAARGATPRRQRLYTNDGKTYSTWGDHG